MMARKTIILCCTCLAVWLGTTSFSLRFHKFYTSITQVEYNLKTSHAEIILNVFADDWEKALEQLHHKTVKADSPLLDQLSIPYLKKHVKFINRKGVEENFQLIGSSLKADLISFYIEVPIQRNLSDYRMLQSCLTDLFPDQINIVNIINQEHKHSISFKSGTPAQPL